MIQRGLFNAVRSSIFLAAFVGTYMRLACIMRDVFLKGWISKDRKYYYWLIGFISSWSILIEDKKRRAELAMYVLPKGVDSFYQLLLKRKWMITIPYFEVLMFSTGMGLIISFFQNEPEVLSSILYRLLRRVNLTIEDREVIEKVKNEIKKRHSI